MRQKLLSFEVRLPRECTVRRRRRAVAALPALVILVTFAAIAPPPARPAVFPAVTADALDKQRITLPAQLAGRTNLLLLSFAPDQAAQVDTWTAVAQALQHTDTGFRAYRLPVEERENELFRWWANASLRSAETDPELWHWVVPLYVEKKPFLAQLGIADEKSVVALLVERGGHILWRASGASSAQTRASLQAAVSAAGPGGSR